MRVWMTCSSCWDRAWSWSHPRWSFLPGCLRGIYRWFIPSAQYIPGYTLRKCCRCMVGGKYWKPLIWLFKETEKVPQGYQTLPLQPLSGPIEQAGIPQHLHFLALLILLPIHFIQPSSAAFVSFSSPFFFISSCLTMLHFVYISELFVLLWFIVSIIPLHSFAPIIYLTANHCLSIHPTSRSLICVHLLALNHISFLSASCCFILLPPISSIFSVSFLPLFHFAFCASSKPWPLHNTSCAVSILRLPPGFLSPYIMQPVL